MQNLKILALFGLAVITAVCGASFSNASAQNETLSDHQIELIKSNCVTTKNTLNQLHASDGLLRVNRGQIYESMLTKLMDRFNSRLATNNFGNGNLVLSAGNYKYMLDKFRTDYKAYEEQLSMALSINCSTQPSDFYYSVVSAREKRLLVHSDVTNLNNYIDRYKSDVLQFEKDYNFVADGFGG